MNFSKLLLTFLLVTSPVYTNFLYVDFDDSMQTSIYPQVIAYAGSARLLAFLKNLYEKNNPSKIKAEQELKIPNIIHQIWFGGKLPAEFEPYRQSWLDLHPDWFFIFWTDNSANYDKGMLLLDFDELEDYLANPLLSERCIVIDIKYLQFDNRRFFDEAHNYGEKSDILKWEIVYRFGGVYVDTDYEALKPLDVLHHTYDFYTGIQPLDTSFTQLGAALYGAVPHHPILKQCVEGIKDNRDKPQIVVKTGPIHFTKSFIAAADRGKTVDIALPASYLYPCDYGQKGMPRSVWQKPESFAVHHWAGSWLKPEAFERS